MTKKQRQKRAANLRKQRAEFARIRQAIKDAFSLFDEKVSLVSDYHRQVEAQRLKRLALSRSKKLKIVS